MLAISATMLVAGLAASPASAQDMRNIANEKGSSERPYGETRGWAVSSGWIGPKFAYCVAERIIDGEPLRIGFDNAQWQLALPVPAKKDYEGAITVDGRRWPASGSSDGKWTFVWLALDMLDSLRNGREVIFDINRASINKPLAGIAASITKVEECLQKKGVAPASMAAAPAQPPAQAFQQQSQPAYQAAPAPAPQQGQYMAAPAPQQGYQAAPAPAPAPQQQGQYAPVIPANPGAAPPPAAPQPAPQSQYAPIIPANPGAGQPQTAPQSAPQRQAMVQPAPAPATPGVDEISPGVYRMERQLADGWSMFRFTSDRAGRQPLQCMVFKMTGSELGMRVGMDRASRTLTYGLMGDATGTIKGNTPLTYWFDNDRNSGQTLPAYLHTELDQSEWLSIAQTIAGSPFENGLMTFQKITFAYRAEGKQKSTSIPLKGGAAAFKGLLECVDR